MKNIKNILFIEWFRELKPVLSRSICVVLFLLLINSIFTIVIVPGYEKKLSELDKEYEKIHFDFIRKVKRINRKNELIDRNKSIVEELKKVVSKEYDPFGKNPTSEERGDRLVSIFKDIQKSLKDEDSGYSFLFGEFTDKRVTNESNEVMSDINTRMIYCNILNKFKVIKKEITIIKEDKNVSVPKLSGTWRLMNTSHLSVIIKGKFSSILKTLKKLTVCSKTRTLFLICKTRIKFDNYETLKLNSLCTAELSFIMYPVPGITQPYKFIHGKVIKSSHKSEK